MSRFWVCIYYKSVKTTNVKNCITGENEKKTQDQCYDKYTVRYILSINIYKMSLLYNYYNNIYLVTVKQSDRFVITSSDKF